MNKILNFEIKRKTFHLSAIIFPIIYLFSSKIAMCVFLTLATGATIYLDISRHYNLKIKKLTGYFFKNIQRPKEKSGTHKLSGASYMALGLLVTVVFFTKGLAITSWIILIVSDYLAAILGIKYGRPLVNGKSYIGSITFFLTAILISIVSYFLIGYNTSFLTIMVSCLLSTAVEFFSEQLGINDNLSIPIVYAFATFILSSI